MSNNYSAWNKKLKFSWAHIFAAIATLAICYFSFLGLSYLKYGNFAFAGFIILIIVVSILAFFILPQQLKGADHNFNISRKLEYVLLFASFFAFIVIIKFPVARFASVASQSGTIKKEFTEAIRASNQIFVEYENYANARLQRYKDSLTAQKENDLARENKTETLQRQLLGGNFKEVKTQATTWIDNVQDVSVFNPFVFGNIDRINAALENWNKQLTDFSTKKMQDENADTQFFPDKQLEQTKEKLMRIKHNFSTPATPKMWFYLLALLAYAMLLLPYLVQDRNTKAVVANNSNPQGIRNIFTKPTKDSTPDNNQPRGLYDGTIIL